MTAPVQNLRKPNSDVAQASTEQKCNYCAGTGKWSKDIIPGKPAENVNCPHCHGSGKTGHGTIERVAPEDSSE